MHTYNIKIALKQLFALDTMSSPALRKTYRTKLKTANTKPKRGFCETFQP